MPFLLPNQQRQSTEGNQQKKDNIKKIHTRTHTPVSKRSHLQLGLNKSALALRVPGVFSLARLPSSPSCTKISSSRTSRSFIATSPCTLAAMFANAFITADDTCLSTNSVRHTYYFTNKTHFVSMVLFLRALQLSYLTRITIVPKRTIFS